MRKITFTNDKYYHIYNRGVDKREIFSDQQDFERFLQSMEEFNCIDPIGSIYENSFVKTNKPQLGSLASKLVDFVCYCVNPNHYHFLLKQVVDNGIEKFMHRLGTGYTKYFNNKTKRMGALFQGSFKSVYIDTNEYLLHLSVYINLNDQVHSLGSLASKSSWDEYVGGKKAGNFCEKEIILDQFKNADEYSKFATSSLAGILERKEREKEIENLLME